MSTVDNYLIPRKDISENWDNKHLLEVNGLCPLCGDYLLKQKKHSIHKNYQIAHIYPNKPDKHQLTELKGLEKLGSNCEDFMNKIVLCKNCHGEYDNSTTRLEYLNLVEIKKRYLYDTNSKIELSFHDLEPQIEEILHDLSNFNLTENIDLKLNYDALRISNKIEDDYRMLRTKIEFNVCMYYEFIRQQFKNLEQSNILDFNLIATEFKLAFLKCDKKSLKSDVFNSLVEWVQSKTSNKSLEACEVIVSFFVQNCEVFNEIPQ